MTPTTKKLGAVALAAAVLTIGFATVVSPPAQAAAADCNEERSQDFGAWGEGTLSASVDSKDIVKIVAPDLSSPHDITLEVTENGTSDPLVFELWYLDANSVCKQESSDDVVSGFEVTSLTEDREYFVHVALDDDELTGDYALRMFDNS